MDKVIVRELDFQTLHRMYVENNVRITEIAKIFGKDTKEVFYQLCSAGIRPVSKQGPRSTVIFELDPELQGKDNACNEAIHYLYHRGYSDYRIAKVCGVTEDLVRGRRKAMGLDTKDRPDNMAKKEASSELTGYLKGQKGLTPAQASDAIHRLESLAAKQGRTPSSSVWDSIIEETVYPSHALEYHFGSWISFVEKAGLTPARGATTPRENVEAYMKACQEAGRVLTPYEYGEAMGGAGTSLPGNKYLQRYKRMFNNINGTSRHLKDELLSICLEPLASSKFLDTHFPR